MPSSKDILEAQRFNRSRLITAFTSGTPNGREVDTPSPVRPLIFGVVVAVIMCVIGVGTRFFSSNPDLNTVNYELINVKDTGARYFWANGVLHPIKNITTAKLLAPESGLGSTKASAAALENYPRGPQLGLDNVPEDVPAAKQLASTWLSCDLDDSSHTWIAKSLPSEQFKLTETTSALVTPDHGGTRYFIEGTTHKKYLINDADSRESEWALAFQNIIAYPIDVEPEWLELFPSGTQLRSWSYHDIPNAGQPATKLPGSLKDKGLTIGMVVDQIDSNGQVLNSYLVVDEANLAVFNSTAARLYKDAPTGKQLPTEEFKDIAPVHADFIGEDWPPYEHFAQAEWANDKRDSATQTVVCAKMDTTDHAVPKIGLYTMPKKDADAASYDPESLNATTGPVTTRKVTVGGGSGALVAISPGGGEAAAYGFVSDLGYFHSLGDVPSTSIKLLGWTQADATAIPQAWSNLIPQGAELTPKAAAASVGLS